MTTTIGSEYEFKNPLTGERTWVLIHQQDDIFGLHPIYLSDPAKFEPQRHPTTELFEKWGIVEYMDIHIPKDDNDLVKRLICERLTEREYLNQIFYHKIGSPQFQFISQLMVQKEEELSLRDSSERKTRDYKIRITMPDIEDENGKEFIFRLIKVSGGMNLSVFQDKILTPVMGWARNHHGYYFIDRADGALFGPQDAAYIDMRFAYLVGHRFLPDTNYTIADLLEAPGQSIGYIYDLGTQWTHEITVEKISSKEKSTGKFVFIDAAGACPGEDMGGDRKWSASLNRLKVHWLFPEFFLGLRAAANYGYRSTKHHFDIFKFDFDEAERAVAEALASRLSKRPHLSDNQTNILGLNPNPNTTDTMGTNNTNTTDTMAANNTTTSNNLPTPPNTQADPRSLALCEQCGSPFELKQCGKCRGVWYCSTECQHLCWPTHKKVCKRFITQ